MSYYVRSCTIKFQETVLQFVSGVGGVGKTSLANLYAVRFSQHYTDGDIFFDAQSHPSLEASLNRNVSFFSFFQLSIAILFVYRSYK